MKTRKIGSKFWWHVDPDTNIQLEVVEVSYEHGCKGCYCSRGPCCLADNNDITGPCISELREDGKDVIFREVKENEEKGGEEC